MAVDLELAKTIPARRINDVAAELGLAADDFEPYGNYAAKIDPRVVKRVPKKSSDPKLVLVSAITPTPAGEGKTTTSIGLAQGLRKLGHSVCLALREPSLGPCLGMKGGATGGGLAQIRPADRINLHFTGDLHAVTSAHNLLAALIDNHLHFEPEKTGLDPRRVSWPRVMDMNDRSLRRLVLGLGGSKEGVPREGGFEITAASEVMAAMCLANDAEDLRARLSRIVVGHARSGATVTAKEVGAPGAMLALLRDALWPNLVQTLEGGPAFVHGGPFANIAHGCNSVIATKMSMHLAEWTITEAGFGFDLGGEKFFDIKCRMAGLSPAAVVLVATVRALKMHGGIPADKLGAPDADAVRRGIPNLVKHIESARGFGYEPVVALNRFASDTPEEIAAIAGEAERLGLHFAPSDHHQRGGEGAIGLAEAVLSTAKTSPVRYAYDEAEPIPAKLEAIARKIYGARGIVMSDDAKRDLEAIDKAGLSKLLVCVAKTQNSLTDDPARRGRPEGFDIHVRRLQVSAGAGFVVALTGEILRMPGLPRRPLAEKFDLIGDDIVGME
ncbi:MAG: formate--tetrahydrofolate ligase [Deltaproteobacteria bacterium]|nr:formate--tetrahydrofolate ligase [Deltaproteobacteria bacterium]